MRHHVGILSTLMGLPFTHSALSFTQQAAFVQHQNAAKDER